jgi:hypothetical protein
MQLDKHNRQDSSEQAIIPSLRPILTQNATHKHTHTNTQNRRTTMPSAGFEPAIPAISRLQTYALDRTVTGIGNEII